MSSTLVEQKETEVQISLENTVLKGILEQERLDDVQNIVEAWAEMSRKAMLCLENQRG